MKYERGLSEGEFLVAFVLLAGVGLLIYTVDTFPTPPRPVRAMGQLARLSMALGEYRGHFGSYPPDTGYGLDPAKSPGTYDAGSLWRHLTRPVVDPTTGREVGPFLEEWPKECMAPYDDPKLGPSFRLTDPWGNPFGFVSDPKRVIHNKGLFDLFSVGPDGVTASDEPGAAPNVA